MPKDHARGRFMSDVGSFNRLFVSILGIIANAYAKLMKLQKEYRKRIADRNEPLNSHNIFLPPIDEDKMADSILEILEDFFGYDKTYCTIADKAWNITDFSLLIFIALRRMHILQNTFRKPFCLFLQDKVLMDSTTLKVKNFNNYANRPNYKTLMKELTKSSPITDMQMREHQNPYFRACHEIIRAFQKTEYFKELKAHKANFSKFNI